MTRLFQNILNLVADVADTQTKSSSKHMTDKAREQYANLRDESLFKPDKRYIILQNI